MTETFKPGTRVMVCKGPEEVLHHTGTVMHSPSGYVVVAVDGHGGYIFKGEDLEALPPAGATDPAIWLRSAAQNLCRRPGLYAGHTVPGTDSEALVLLLDAAVLCAPYDPEIRLQRDIAAVPTSVRAEDYERLGVLWAKLADYADRQSAGYYEMWCEATSGEAARSARDDDERGN